MTIKRPPLTKEQQETVTQWRPLAIRYTRRLLFGYGLRDFEDEIPGLAAEALVEAARVWDPKRARFATCLRWWVRRVLQSFRAHGARVVHQSMSTRPKDFVANFSLDQHTHNGTYETADMTWADLLVDESLGDPAETVDTRRLLRAAFHVLPIMVAGRDPTRRQLAHARESVRLWGERQLDGDTTLQELGDACGITREGVRRRVLNVQEAFEAWARPIREEAA
jgi:DNA-directed RNA polymerase sigma subunit (sigma70/sigma32)